MLAIFSFAMTLALSVETDGATWCGPCEGHEFVDTSPDSFPLRGDVTFLNEIPVEITIRLRKDGQLNDTMMESGLDERVRAHRSEGYACDQDVYLLRYWEATSNQKQFLSMHAALAGPKFRRVHHFLHSHIGKPDIVGSLSCSFHGFSEPYSEMPNIPTTEGFLAGEQYISTDDLRVSFGFRRAIQ